MDYIFKKGLTLLLLILVVKTLPVFCAGVSFKKYSYSYNNNGKCIPNATAFEAEAKDPIACGKMCHLNSDCESFHYQPDIHRCIGCRYKRYDGPPLKDNETRIGSMYFSQVENFPSDCKDILRNNPYAETGVHEIQLWKSKETLEVFCDMQTAGGGWTVFQNRFNGTVDFDRYIVEYQDTFGHLYGEFWLGLKYIKEIAAQGTTEIRLDLSDGFGRHGYEAFQDFRLSGDNEYTLHILEESRSFSGGIQQFQNASNGLAGNNGHVFAAMSGFLPTDYYRRCPVDEKSGWWYDYYCGGVDLNGPYLTPGTLWNESTGDKTPGFKHFGFAGNYSLKASRMMIRRK